MIIPDVNVWIPALRSDLPDHGRYREWLSEAVAAEESVGISELIFSAVVRVLTNPRVFHQPSPSSSVLAALRQIRYAEGTVVVRPGDGHWDVFENLCVTSGAIGNLVPDAYHAALAIEHDATFVTGDRHFRRFDGLRCRHPFD